MVKWSDITKYLSSWRSHSKFTVDLWEWIYKYFSENFNKVLKPVFDLTSLDWKNPNWNRFIFGNTTFSSTQYPIQYSKFNSFDNTRTKFNMFRGLEVYLAALNKQMGIVIVTTAKLAQALSLGDKSKFFGMGEWCSGFDKTKVQIATNVKNLSIPSSTKLYVVYDTGMQKSLIVARVKFEPESSSSHESSSSQVKFSFFF